jgi:hypothetical protein
LAAGALIAVSAAPQLIAAVRPMTQPDVRDVVASKILAMSPSPALVGFASTPWFWSPPLNPYFTLPRPWGWKPYGGETRVPSVLISDDQHPFDVDLLQHDRPAVVVLSEWEYYDRLRLKEPAALAYCRYLRQHYSIDVYGAAGLFDRPAAIDGIPASKLPPDMLYVSPTTLLCHINAPSKAPGIVNNKPK